MQIKKAAKPAVLIVLLLVLMQAPVFAAADFSDITQSFNSEMSSFGDTLGIFVSGFRAVARIIAISMMAIAGVMVAFNVQDGRKAFWNWMLGIGACPEYLGYPLGYLRTGGRLECCVCVVKLLPGS